MANFRQIFTRIFFVLTPLTGPFTAWLYRSKFSRKIVLRLIMVGMAIPCIGYFRRPYVLHQYKDQIQAEIQMKQTEMKQTLGQAQLDFASDNNFQYLVLVRSQKNYEDEELFEKQKILFSLNNQILSKNSENQNYFDGIRFLYVGGDRIFEALTINLPKQEDNQFDFINREIKKGGMSIPKPDSVLLIAKQSNGDNRIVMQWPFDENANLKAIIRQISKHKHKKYVQQMNF